jgi:hypothetical protein
MNYQATLFAPDGASVTDFRNIPRKEWVWDGINDMGSRWIFYPIAFVTTRTTVVDTPTGLEYFRGKRLKTVRKYLAAQWAERADEIADKLNEGAPYWAIYPSIAFKL